MPRCKQCNKFGFFLKLQDGVCGNCIAKAVVGKTPLKKENKTTSALSNKSLFDELCSVQLPYNFKALKPYRIATTVFYLINNKNDMDLAKKTILNTQCYIDEAKKILPSMPRTKIFEERIRFDAPSNIDRVDFSFISIKEYTKTGKMPKFPFSLSFKVYYSRTNVDWDSVNGIHGDIYYELNGQIGKAEIVYWHNKNCFIIDVTKEKGLDKLSVSRIQTFVDYKKIIIYKRDN